MFCTSLRKRPSTSPLVELLVAPPPGLNLKESSLKTHDIALPLHVPSSSTKTTTPTQPAKLLILILTPSDLTTTPASTTTQTRIQHFASLTAPAHLLLTLILNDTTTNNPNPNPTPQHQHHPLTHLQTLQHTLLTTPALIPLPLLPIPTLSLLPQHISAYAATLQRNILHSNPAGAAPPASSSTSSSSSSSGGSATLSLLAHATASLASTGRPLSLAAAVALSDVAGEWRGVVRGVLDADGDGGGGQRMVMLERVLGVEGVRAVREFWEEEWAV